MTLAIMAFTGLAAVFVASQLTGGRAAAVAYEPAHARGVAHVGATETWSPAAEIAADAPPATVAHAEADVAELTILADFDVLIESWRADPDWLTDYRASVDAYHVEHALDTADHHRWRWGVVDVPTGEYQQIPAPEGAL